MVIGIDVTTVLRFVPDVSPFASMCGGEDEDEDLGNICLCFSALLISSGGL